ncbi:hypothetical protein BGZ60DRAFT_374537, partial [Tricladium varicosporioides]
LWLGCLGPRNADTNLPNLRPVAAFVYRNIANPTCPTNHIFLLVLNYPIIPLKIRYVIFCGNTDCGGCSAALSMEDL